MREDELQLRRIEERREGANGEVRWDGADREARKLVWAANLRGCAFIGLLLASG